MGKKLTFLKYTVIYSNDYSMGKKLTFLNNVLPTIKTLEEYNMEALWLLAKINTVFQIAEKVAYGAIAVYGAFIAKKYVDDYRMSVDDEKRLNGGVK